MKKVAKKNSRISSLEVDFDREDDGRWIAEVPTLPGVLAYGKTRREALENVYAVALRTLADRAEEGSFFTPIFRLLGYGVARN
jgi:predicted RNase H-like HicB family nuclease